VLYYAFHYTLLWLERTRQAWRSTGDLLLPQRIDAALFANVVRPKNKQDNLSKAGRNELAKLVDILVAAWIER
jgi:hypothetical protein